MLVIPYQCRKIEVSLVNFANIIDITYARFTQTSSILHMIQNTPTSSILHMIPFTPTSSILHMIQNTPTDRLIRQRV